MEPLLHHCAMVAKSLKQICKAGRKVDGNKMVSQGIRSFLFLHTGKQCPDWINDLFWEFVPVVPRGIQAELTICTWMRTVTPAIVDMSATDEESSDSDSGDSDGDDSDLGYEFIRIQATLYVDVAIFGGRAFSWKVNARSPDGQLLWKKMRNFPWDLRVTLESMRRAFDRRKGMTPVAVEVPATELSQWETLIGRWLFGPPPPVQQEITDYFEHPRNFWRPRL